MEGLWSNSDLVEMMIWSSLMNIFPVYSDPWIWSIYYVGRFMDRNRYSGLFGRQLFLWEYFFFLYYFKIRGDSLRSPWLGRDDNLGITFASFIHYNHLLVVALWIILDILWKRMGLLFGWVSTSPCYNRFSFRGILIEGKVSKYNLLFLRW